MDAPVEAKPLVSVGTAKAIVAVLSALIILALIGLVGGFVWKLSGGAKAPAASAGANFILPAGAQVVSMETQPGRVILHVRAGGRDEIDILDTDDGHLIARIAPAR